MLMTHLCHKPGGGGDQHGLDPERTFGGRAKPIPSPSLKVRTARLGRAILPRQGALEREG